MNGARYAYLKRVCELTAGGSDFVIVSDDYAAPVLDGFRRDYPQRFLSVGIAEQNLIAVSCGLAAAGKRAIAYGCAPFPVTRGFDIIKNAASLMNLPITIVTAGIGFAIPEWGATHYNIDDVAIMRTLPNMRIITPADNITGIYAAGYSLVNTAPVYMRFDKYAEGELYSGKTIDFERGFEVLLNGVDAAIITCGYFSRHILELAKEWNVSARIIDLYSLPFDADALAYAVDGLPVVTVEEHITAGGIGSAVLEMLNEKGLPNRIKRMGIDFSGGYPQSSGSREYYIEKFGLSDNDITSVVYSMIEKT
jgi:transketolase